MRSRHCITRRWKSPVSAGRSIRVSSGAGSSGTRCAAAADFGSNAAASAGRRHCGACGIPDPEVASAPWMGVSGDLGVFRRSAPFQRRAKWSPWATCPRCPTTPTSAARVPRARTSNTHPSMVSPVTRPPRGCTRPMMPTRKRHVISAKTGRGALASGARDERQRQRAFMLTPSPACYWKALAARNLLPRSAPRGGRSLSGVSSVLVNAFLEQDHASRASQRDVPSPAKHCRVQAMSLRESPARGSHARDNKGLVGSWSGFMRVTRETEGRGRVEI